MPKGIYTRTEKYKNEVRERMKGKVSPMKGKKHTEEAKQKNKEKHIGRGLGNTHSLGYKHTIEAKRKIGKASEGNQYAKGSHRKDTEETKKKRREWQINNPNRKFKDTSIELKVEAELQKRGINYQKQVPLCKIAIVDFYLPEYRIVIQADGDYWHNRPGAKEKDERQDKVLTFNGFNVYRFWEHEINKSVEECIDKIKI